MHSSTWHLQTFLLSIFAITFLYLVASQVVSQDVPKPWYENLPAVAMDYKVHIDAGKEDCYHQYVQAGATFYVSFSVVRGGDGMAGFAVRNPSGAIVKPYQWQATADYTDQASPGGYYSVCIDNQFSRFAGKLVNIYITVVKYDAWDKYAKEIEALQLNMENFTSTIGTVERNINDMLAYQYHSRNREARDYALLEDNNAYIRNFSISQILVIVFTCSVQVGILNFVDILSVFHYLHKLSQRRFFPRQLLCAKRFWVFFVRKLFTVKNSGSSRSRI